MGVTGWILVGAGIVAGNVGQYFADARHERYSRRMSELGLKPHPDWLGGLAWAFTLALVLIVIAAWETTTLAMILLAVVGWLGLGLLGAAWRRYFRRRAALRHDA